MVPKVNLSMKERMMSYKNGLADFKICIENDPCKLIDLILSYVKTLIGCNQIQLYFMNEMNPSL